VSRWLLHFRLADWTRDQDRALIAEGWARLRAGGDTIACALVAPSEPAARAAAARVLRLEPVDVTAA
jgi:hypothetical protein